MKSKEFRLRVEGLERLRKKDKNKRDNRLKKGRER